MNCRKEVCREELRQPVQQAYIRAVGGLSTSSSSLGSTAGNGAVLGWKTYFRLESCYPIADGRFVCASTSTIAPSPLLLSFPQQCSNWPCPTCLLFGHPHGTPLFGNRFDFQRGLGTGAFKQYYLVQEKVSDRLVVIKYLFPSTFVPLILMMATRTISLHRSWWEKNVEHQTTALIALSWGNLFCSDGEET